MGILLIKVVWMDVFSFPPTVYLYIKNRWSQRLRNQAATAAENLQTQAFFFFFFSSDLSGLSGHISQWNQVGVSGESVDKTEHLWQRDVTINLAQEGLFDQWITLWSSVWTHACPIGYWMAVTGGRLGMERLKPKVWSLRKINLNLTSMADGWTMIGEGDMHI